VVVTSIARRRPLIVIYKLVKAVLMLAARDRAVGGHPRRPGHLGSRTWRSI